MRRLLGREGTRRVAQLKRQRLLVALDFDGTLCAIEDRPAKAKLTARTRRLLSLLAARRPVAVVSGRSRADLERLLAGCGIQWLVGNHGAESSAGGPSQQRLIDRWRTALAPALESIEGAWLEDKHHSLSVHFRGARPRASAERLGLLLAGFEGMRTVGGKRVLNLVPATAPHKGQAVRRLMKQTRSEAVLFVGDDTTDEDVFALPLPVEGVRVGRRRGSKARWWLSAPEVNRLLELLAQ